MKLQILLGFLLSQILFYIYARIQLEIGNLLYLGLRFESIILCQKFIWVLEVAFTNLEYIFDLLNNAIPSILVGSVVCLTEIRHYSLRTI